MIRPFGRTVAALAFALLALLAFPGCGGRSGPPNLLLVTLDTTRADRIGCYGYAPAHTPHLDRLAGRGVRFDEALTSVPVTCPAHATLLTGLYPLRHGVRNNGAYVLPASAETLAERLSASGYATAAFVSAFVLDAQFGTAQGFQTYDDELYNERPGPRTTELALRWLSQKDERPFFLWVHLFDPHTPWTPAPMGRALDLPDDYDREIAVVDDCVGKLLAALEADGRLENTIVAVLGDHGEGLGDHGEVEHGIFLYRETTRVPFLLAGPGVPADGRVLATPVGTVDFVPTLTGLLGLPVPEPCDGADLRDLLAGGAAPDRRGLYLETIYPQEDFGWAPLAAFVSDSWRFIEAPTPELYDVSVDPAERRNLAGERVEQAETMRARLDRFRQTAGEPLARPQSAGVSSEVQERLRSLGYLSGGVLASGDDGARPDPKDMIAFATDFEVARRAMDDGRFADAVDPFRKVLASNPKSSLARLGLGVALVRLFRMDEAEAVLRQALAESPRNTTVQSALADALFGQREYAGALELYRLAKADPTLGPRHVPTRIVICLDRTGRRAEADGALARFKSENAADSAYWDDFARRLATDRALEAQIGARPRPGVDSARALERARACAGIGVAAEALAWLDLPADTPEREQERLDLRATLFAETRRPAEALVALDALIARAGSNPGKQMRRAGLLQQQHRHEEALAIYESLGSAELPPEERTRLDYNRACALARLGRKEEALSALRQAVNRGYDRIAQLFNDADLATLRNEPAFLELADSLAARVPS